MSDNTEFWKGILGDDYSEEVMRILQGQPDSEHEDIRPKAGGEAGAVEDEGARFYTYEAGMPTADENRGGGQNRGGVPSKGARKAPSDEDEFNVEFDFNKEYGEMPSGGEKRRGRENRGCLGGLAYALFIICSSLLLASFMWLAATDVLGLGGEDGVVQVSIPEDFTIDQVADILHEGGLIKYKLLFKLYAELSDAKDKIAPGTYELNKDYDYRALVSGMSARGGKRVEVDVTIPEGYTMKQIFTLLDANGVCDEEDLWEAAANYDFDYEFLDKSTLGDRYRLEGFLFPDTYTFYASDSPTRAISKMLSNFRSKFKDEYTARAKELGYSVREIVIIASMIEKEAGADSERALIASVIYNRLKNPGDFPYLQIDATIYYAIAQTGEEFSTNIDSPYNTYVHKGLPVGPISNPGLNSIKAALYPEKTGYYYYALNKSGTHNFFKDAAAFNAFVRSDEYGG